MFNFYKLFLVNILKKHQLVRYFKKTVLRSQLALKTGAIGTKYSQSNNILQNLYADKFNFQIYLNYLFTKQLLQ